MNTVHLLVFDLVSHPSDPETTTEDELIFKYFTEGHSYEVIIDFLATKHNISISLSTLKRRLKDVSLTRRTNYTPITSVRAAISEELKGSGQLLGYRAMWQTLKQKYSLIVRRGDVMRLMGELDRSGVENCEDLSKEHTTQWDPMKSGMLMGMTN